ncbi:thiamine biosynthesis protein ThiF [Rhodoblastus sp. 17X3]|uniref:thiamine biosynthesis protein ThiF n=1 Tax=Rhodoblastus sp. 17X3 TaxID=3047026 RepID=UPI0024B83801|nr:thiamine biosynthesis protein ThiF [Rhodoblastus sp. 17X3]MDI9847642.1 thiamine biosynthesis protein ThiF [Rhodoblastus sp. 17X3]
MKLAINRGLRLVGLHPAVLDCRVTAEHDDGSVVAEVDMWTELPAAWRTKGESLNGVRATESVTLHFPASYPLHAPVITLRPDFNRSHPHINPGPAHMPPQPCLIAGSASELLQSRGIEGLIDQLAEWLDRAAMLALNNAENGWEPVRRDAVMDIAVVDGTAIRNLMTPGGGCLAVKTGFLYVADSDNGHFRIDHRSLEIVDLNVRPYGLQQITPNAFRGVSVGLLIWAPAEETGKPPIVDTYLPETVTNVGELIERAGLYGCSGHLNAKINQIAFQADQAGFGKIPFLVTLMTPRPYPVIGTGSPIELCSYVIDLSTLTSIERADRAIVRPCALREQLSEQILRRTSGAPEYAARTDWTLVGCGSVGSKIAIHLARQGSGPARVVDHSFMSPHNYARHALTPDDNEWLGFAGQKAEMLAGEIQRLRQGATFLDEDVLAISAEEQGRQRLASESTKLVLNTTASTIVREVLSCLPWEARPQLGETHLLAAGTVAYAAFEGPNGNPNLSDLAAESYRMIAADENLRREVFSAQAQEILIGQGCSAATFPMPDDRLSALTAGLSCVVAQRLGATPSNGEIAIGNLHADGLSQSWMRCDIRPWTIISDDETGIGVRISPLVDEAIRSDIAAKPQSETGGVIVGRFSHINNSFQVVDLIPAPPDSMFSQHQFVLGTAGLKAQTKRLYANSGGTLYVLGTWHNHLVTSGPSLQDKATALILSLRQCFPVLMLIALPDGYTCVVAE